MQNWGNYFTSMAVIGGKMYCNHPRNLNHVHNDTKYLVSVIITLGKDISGVDTVLYDGVKPSDFGSRAPLQGMSEFLDINQMLPLPYLRSFSGGPGDQVLKKNGYWTWQIEQKYLSWNVLNPG